MDLFCSSCSEESLACWFEMFIFSNVWIWYYKFSSQHCIAVSDKFWYVVFSFSFIHFFSKFPLIFSVWPMDYLEVCCLVSKCLEIFLLSFCYWFLVWFQRTYCDQKIYCMISIFLKFIEVFFSWLSMWPVLVNVMWVLKKNVYSAIDG